MASNSTITNGQPRFADKWPTVAWIYDTYLHMSCHYVWHAKQRVIILKKSRCYVYYVNRILQYNIHNMKSRCRVKSFERKTSRQTWRIKFELETVLISIKYLRSPLVSFTSTLSRNQCGLFPELSCQISIVSNDPKDSGSQTLNVDAVPRLKCWTLTQNSTSGLKNIIGAMKELVVHSYPAY